MNRRERAFKENIYLINMEPIIKEDERIFNVLGQSGNRYTISINDDIECTCLDFQTRNVRCKHIFFVLCRICKCNKIPSTLSSINRIKLFSNIPIFIDNKLLFKENIISIEEKVQKIDDCCPICLDDLTFENIKLLNYCKYGCGKSFHINCFNMCNKLQISQYCAFCRHKL